MPLFDWSSSTSMPSATGNFWVYWATTIPATILVLVIWRVWYVFNEWRQTNGTTTRIHKDFQGWVNSRWLEIDREADLESGKAS